MHPWHGYYGVDFIDLAPEDFLNVALAIEQDAKSQPEVDYWLDVACRAEWRRLERATTPYT